MRSLEEFLLGVKNSPLNTLDTKTKNNSDQNDTIPLISPRVLSLAEAGYGNTSGSDLNKLSFSISAFAEYCWKEDGNHDHRPVGSLSRAVDILRKGIHIHTETPVSRIVWHNPDTLYVESSNGKNVNASAIVLTVPPAFLHDKIVESKSIETSNNENKIPTTERILFEPCLPDWKQSAARTISFEIGVKLIVVFDTICWPKNCHGIICSDCFFPEIWMQEQETSEKNRENPSFYYATAFLMGQKAKAVINLAGGVKEASFLLIDQIQRIFKTHPVEHYLTSILADWGKVPYVRGAYTSPSVTEAKAAAECNRDTRNSYNTGGSIRQLLSKPVDGKLFFAGEATHSSSFMTAHTAMETGHRAALEVINTLNGIK